MAITHVWRGLWVRPDLQAPLRCSLPHGLQVGSFFVRPKAFHIDPLKTWRSRIPKNSPGETPTPLARRAYNLIKLCDQDRD